MQHIFSNNYQLCSEISESVLQHFIHCLATHGRHVQYLNFLHTIIKAEGKYVKKCQDMIMTEVRRGGGTGRLVSERGAVSCTLTCRSWPVVLSTADQRRRGCGRLLQ